MLLVACGRTQPTPYRPPTPESVSQPVNAPAQPSLTPLASPVQTEAPRPTTAARCTSGLTYLEDLTIPDGSPVEPEAKLDKRWRVENSGTCNWDQDYRLKLVSGTDLGAPTEQSLFPARSNTTADLRIRFTAPNESGIYRSAWQAHDPSGVAFGDPIFIEIVVP